jgi:hypothetical protein
VRALRKFLHWPVWLVLAALVLAALVPALSLFHSSAPLKAYASGVQRSPIVPHVSHHLKHRTGHAGPGVSRAHLLTLPLLAGQTKRAGTSTIPRHGALISANVNPNTTSTLFFDDMESGAPGWTTVGDNNMTSYYPTGHDFWNLVQSPDSLSVPNPTVNPNLVSYPDPSGMLPAAHSGTHAWWYGDNPAVDTSNPPGASMTYMGNQSDWPAESPSDGGTSNGSNTAALISPTINLTSAPNATLTFATWWEIESTNPAHFDMMYVDVTTDGGSSWTTLGVLNPMQNPSGGSDAYPYTSNGLDAPASWQIASVDLSPYVGSQVQVRFRFDTIDQYDNGFRGWFIDDIGVYTNSAGSPLVSTVTPNSGMAGDTITITGSGFGAQQNSSTVTFNGVAAAIQGWSDSSIVATVPAGATSGPLVITVNGVQTAAVNFTVNASISLYSPTSSPQTIDPVSGQGFAAKETIAIYLNGVNGSLLASASADANGKLPATNLTIPTMPAGNYLVLAMGQSSHITAGVTLSIVPALSSAITTVKPGQFITVKGLGFAAFDVVSIQLDSPDGSFVGTLFCDSNGTCSGTALMPSFSVVQGLHLLVGSGTSSGLVAEAPVIFTPGISILPIEGGPGTYIQLSGAAFAANETVQVYWGTTSGISEGTTTTDTSGDLFFSFNSPSGLAAGKYTITVARAHEKPAMLTALFKVLPPKMTSTAGILSGQAVQVQLTGFQAYESVTISWNANGGQQLTTIGMDSTGAASSTFTPPSAPAGSYTLTAIGDSSGLQATSSLNVGAGILLTPNTASPGSTIIVNGGGFTPGETVNVYFQNTANGIVSATVDTTGAFTVSLTVTTKYKAGTNYFVYAIGTTGTDKAKAPFFFVPVAFYSAYYYLSYGTLTTLYGQGFAVNEKVNLYWNYLQAGQLKVGTATAGSDGTFSMTLTVPSDPNLGYVSIAAIGSTSKLKATGSVYEYPNIVLTPSSGPAGTKVKVSGGGYDSAEAVTVFYQGASVATATTSVSGAFAAAFVVPTTTSIGYTTVQATGGTSGVTVYATFTVTPTLVITPTTGPAGTTITVTGKHYSSSSSVYLYWYDPSTGNYSSLGSVTTTSTGTFKTTITAPANLTSGNTYYVQGYDGPTGFFAQAAFIAQ